MPDERENNDPSTDAIDAEIVDAEIVPTVLGDVEDLHHPEVLSTVAPDFHEKSLLDTNVDHLSAKGGAIGGVLLAVLGLAGMAFSAYSLFNVLLATIFSVWGLRSPLRKTAMAGLLIALAGVIAFLVRLDS